MSEGSEMDWCSISCEVDTVLVCCGDDLVVSVRLCVRKWNVRGVTHRVPL